MSQPLEMDQLLRRCGNQESIAYKLLAMYFDQIDEYVQELQSAIAQKNQSEVQRLAHKIKSASVTVSANPLGAAAAEIEDWCKKDKLDTALSHEANLLDQLKALHDFHNKMQTT